MSLFVEKERNRNGYRFYAAAVIEGVVKGDRIVVTAPPEFAKHNVSVERDGFQEVSKKAGPPRIPQISEHGGDCGAWLNSIILEFSSVTTTCDAESISSGIKKIMKKA